MFTDGPEWSTSLPTGEPPGPPVAWIHEQPASAASSAPAGPRPRPAAPVRATTGPSRRQATGCAAPAAGRGGRSGCCSASSRSPSSLPSLWPDDAGEKLTYTEFMTAGRARATSRRRDQQRVRQDHRRVRRRRRVHHHRRRRARRCPRPTSSCSTRTASTYEFKHARATTGCSASPALLLPVLLIIGFFVWMQRRAAGQMGNVMSIGRSRAKAYTPTSRRPRSPTSPATTA